jgi:hypothetical protein
MIESRPALLERDLFGGSWLRYGGPSTGSWTSASRGEKVLLGREAREDRVETTLCDLRSRGTLSLERGRVE